jgi:hypothetical protein
VNDDELLARLKSADPALTRSAPPPDIDRLVEATLNTATATATVPQPAKATAGRSRRHLLGLAAAAGLLVLGGGIATGVMANNGSGSGRSAAPAPVTLTAQGGSAKCAEPTPDSLRGYPTLFVGTVTSVKGSSVTFHIDHWLKGGDAETVVLVGDTSIPETLTFSEGEHYIVGAKDGVVPPCAANGASAETISKFRQAFGK